MGSQFRDQLQSTLGAAYSLERELGGGGMSRVFVAEETALGRKVVVKVLPPELAAGVSVDRFKREIQVAARLQHPHVVPVLTAGEMAGVPYYTMPFVDGESLRARLGREGALPMTDAIGILRDVAKALAYAHERGIVHRDIKPDNVLLSGGSAAVTDFGIAKALTAARAPVMRKETGETLTQMGMSLGTPTYMAPEQAAADPSTDHRADVYAFGCLAYEVLTGRPPFVDKTPQRLLAAHMGERPQPVADLRPDTPAALAELVMRCLEKDAARRPQAALDLVRVLDTVTSAGGGLPAMPAILLGGRGMLGRALLLYAASFIGVAILARAAIVAIGLPDWVFPGALVVMALGLPVILFTGYVHHVARRAAIATPTFTPGGTPSIGAQSGTMATVAMRASPHVSWRRAAYGGVWALAGFALLIGGYMLLRALGIGPAGSLLAAGKLDRDEPLLVADFGTNGGVDGSLGAVVAEAVRTDLSQSSVVSIAPASTIRNALLRMQRPVDSRLDVALAREIAQREGIKGVVTGDITPLGAGFIVTARILAAESGDELASFRATADGPSELIPAVERLSRDLRGKVGESFKAVRATPALAEVTTHSLEALRKYTEGNEIADADIPRAISLLKEAVAIDSTFAMAWRKLAVMYGNGGYPRELRDSAIVRAYRHRDRLTELERYTVLGYYYGDVLGDRDREIETYEAAVAVGDLGAAAHNLGLRYIARRDFARAEAIYRRRLTAPDAPLVSWQNFVWSLYNQGKTAQAESALVVMRQRFPDATMTARMEAFLLYNRGRLDSVRAIATRIAARPDPASRAEGWFALSTLELRGGRLQAWHRAVAESRRAAALMGVPTPPLDDSLSSIINEAWLLDRPERAARRLDALLAARPLQMLPHAERRYFWVTTAYAMAGRPDRGRAIVAQYDADVRDTLVRRRELSHRRWAEAEIALAERRGLEAVELFRQSDQLPDGPTSHCTVCVHADLARAFDAAGMPDSAIVHLERYLTAPELWRLDPARDPVFLAPVLKRLGELYDAKGDAATASKYYARFVDLWKDADPELQPTVREVRERLAQLGGDTRRR